MLASGGPAAPASHTLAGDVSLATQPAGLPAEARAPRTADVVVGVPADPGDPQAAARTREMVEAIEARFPSRSASVFLLTRRRTHAEVDAVPALEPLPPAAADASTRDRPTTSPGGPLRGASGLRALLAAARPLSASACVLVGPERHDAPAEWFGAILRPVLEDGYDFVCPTYARGRLEGTLNSAIVYPLTRALYGRRLLQPLGAEAALSGRLADALLADEEWDGGPAGAGAELALVTAILTGPFRTCQALLGRPPHSAAAPAEDLSDTLARVVGVLFHEAERRASAWQRIAGSEPVVTFGDGGVVEDGTPSAAVANMVAAFELGWQDLRGVWAIVLPPATLVALQRVARQPASTFRMEDALWARVVYDFALAWHMRLMERTQLLRSMTPIYLAWLASHANEVRELDGPGTEARVERLCRAFEETKPYLISRWRWPDRFNP